MAENLREDPSLVRIAHLAGKLDGVVTELQKDLEEQREINRCVDERLDKLVDGIESLVDSNRQQTALLSERWQFVAEVPKKMQAAEERITRLESIEAPTRFDAIDQKLNGIEENLKGLETVNPGAKLADHETRLRANEKFINRLKGIFAALDILSKKKTLIGSGILGLVYLFWDQLKAFAAAITGS